MYDKILRYFQAASSSFLRIKEVAEVGLLRRMYMKPLRGMYISFLEGGGSAVTLQLVDY